MNHGYMCVLQIVSNTWTRKKGDKDLQLCGNLHFITNLHVSCTHDHLQASAIKFDVWELSGEMLYSAA